MSWPRFTRSHLAPPLLGLGLSLALMGCEVSTDALSGQRVIPPPPGVDLSTTERLIESGAPRLEITLLDQGISTLMVRSNAREGVTRWRAIDNAQIFLRNGILIGTRGLSDDLMSADVRDVAPLILAGRAGEAERFHGYLDGEDRLRIRAYVCDVAPVRREVAQIPEAGGVEALLVEEKCHGIDYDLANRYWIASGRVVRSEQFVSDRVGRVQILFLQ